MCASMPTIITELDGGRAEAMAGRYMLKSVLSWIGPWVWAFGRESSAQSGPRAEAFCVVAWMGIERSEPVVEEQE